MVWHRATSYRRTLPRLRLLAFGRRLRLRSLLAGKAPPGACRETAAAAEVEKAAAGTAAAAGPSASEKRAAAATSGRVEPATATGKAAAWIAARGEVVAVGHHLLLESGPLADDRAHELTAQHQLIKYRISSVGHVRVTLRRERNQAWNRLTGMPGGASTIISQFVHSFDVRKMVKTTCWRAGD
ncbi:hypothetical protein PRIPAC_84209 [Pristionchus pacificus]|uniref:Uncharacterized protein n=1 Tax=Pristionchus pacificus TaxID=54126 RepID=A0A2A6BUQ9_PRIPA|nr:hypothetical protein PRIPAC_84209 [Pristionchus pacificus]|eukprot:PDM69635.1 hypothetical protein PRIPAC_44731 [Pristionchus pacificus]